jgi:hypothetical protein
MVQRRAESLGVSARLCRQGVLRGLRDPAVTAESKEKVRFKDDVQWRRAESVQHETEA